MSLYVLATCGAALLASHRWIIAFGIAYLIVLSNAARLPERSITWVWCGCATVVSFTVLVFFHHRRYAPSAALTRGMVIGA